MAKVLCMEVGTSIVRLAEVVKLGKKVQITKVHVFDTPDDATKDGKVRVSDSVVAAIRDGIDESGIKATDVYFVVESTKILFKQVELPLVSRSKIQSTLDLAFSDIFPVDETLYHLSYVFEKKYQKNGQWMMALDVFAVPNDLSESYYNLAVALGLNAKGLTDTSRSMISLFPDSFKNRNIAMVNINENTSTLTITVDGDMIFNKTIPHGVYNTIQTVINSPLTMDNLEFSDAIGYLYTQNLLLRRLPDSMPENPTNEAKLQYDATMSIVSMIKTIEATFAAFLSKENIQINEFHLSGLGAGFDGISQLLEYEFGIPVTVVQQDGNLTIHNNAANEELILGCYPCAGAAIDAANFFTAAEKAGGEIAAKKRLDHMFIFIGVVICLVSIGYSAYSLMQANMALQNAQIENDRLEKRVQELKDRGVEIAYNNYNTAVSYNEEVLNLYDETRSGNEDMTVFLAELESILPTSARVSAITLNPEQASVSFRCEDKFVAAGVLHLLRNMDTIHAMQCTGVGEVEQTNEIGFTCEFTLKSTADRNAENESEGDENGNGDENQGGQQGEDVSQPLVSTAPENTTGDISVVTFGEVEIALDQMTVTYLNELGYTDSGIFTSDNKALSMFGRTFSNQDGMEISITEDVNEGVDILYVDNDLFGFYGGIHVGMTGTEVIDAMASLDIAIEDSDYIIIKNTTHTLVCAQNSTGIIDSIYLLDNTVIETFTDSEYIEDNIDGEGETDTVLPDGIDTTVPENEEGGIE